MNQNEYETVDVFLGEESGNFVVVPKSVIKDSIEAIEAKQVMSALAFKTMKEGGKIYRKSANGFTEIHPEIDYPKLLELVKTMSAKEEEQSLSSGRSR